MWVPRALSHLFTVNRDFVRQQSEEIIRLRAKTEALTTELASVKINSDWLRVQFNQLQFERASLLEKLYGLKVPAPELQRPIPAGPRFDEFNFNDLGDRKAKEFGLPVYDIPESESTAN